MDTPLFYLRGCEIEQDPFAIDARIFTFRFEHAKVTIRVVFWDIQSGADVTFTNMTTLPEAETRKGYGSHALGLLIAFAKASGMNSFIATQVLPNIEDFWIKQGFEKLHNQTNDFKYNLLN
jgi:hypothetical protein